MAFGHESGCKDLFAVISLTVMRQFADLCTIFASSTRYPDACERQKTPNPPRHLPTHRYGLLSKHHEQRRRQSARSHCHHRQRHADSLRHRATASLPLRPKEIRRSGEYLPQSFLNRTKIPNFVSGINLLIDKKHMAQDLNDLMKDVEALRNRNNTFLLDNDPVAQLEPREVFRYFAAITKVPRPSHHEDKMRAFLVHFAEQQQLSWEMDGENVLIRKPASQGQEHRPTLVLQAHMDMVCEKETDVQIDFMNDPIDTYVDGEWVRARGTTLGADDGMGVAMMLAILADKQHPHGAIEALFTADEEQSFTGVDPDKHRPRELRTDRHWFGRCLQILRALRRHLIATSRRLYHRQAQRGQSGRRTQCPRHQN